MNRILYNLKNVFIVIVRICFMSVLEIEDFSCAAMIRHAAAEHIAALIPADEHGLVGFGNNEVMPFDYAHTLYHTQLLDGKVLYYGGLQFDSYWGHRFHYSLNGLFYSVDFTKAYAVEGNLRLTYYVSRHFGLSAVCKIPYIRINEKSGWTYVPLLDLTYLIHPGRTVIRHGLYKNKRRQR